MGFSLWDEVADLLGGAVVRVELAGASGQAGDLVPQCGELGDAGIEGVGVLVEQVLDVAAGSDTSGAKSQDLSDLPRVSPIACAARMKTQLADGGIGVVPVARRCSGGCREQVDLLVVANGLCGYACGGGDFPDTHKAEPNRLTLYLAARSSVEHARTSGRGVMTTTDVDLAVIGSGGAAMSAGITARQAGASVVLVKRGTLGGTCVNVGCVPSKTLLATAGARHAALWNPFPGAPTSVGHVDLAALAEQKDELVGRLRQIKYVDVAAAYGIEVHHGTARFADDTTLEVNGQPLRADAYLIATGAEPARPELPGLDRVDYLTSTTAMELTELPESLVVIGGGYVGVEQAQLFAHLGARVSVIGRLTPRAEPEIATVVRGVRPGRHHRGRRPRRGRGTRHRPGHPWSPPPGSG